MQTFRCLFVGNIQVSCYVFTRCNENGDDGGEPFQFCQQLHHGTNEQALLWQIDEIGFVSASKIIMLVVGLREIRRKLSRHQTGEPQSYLRKCNIDSNTDY